MNAALTLNGGSRNGGRIRHRRSGPQLDQGQQGVIARAAQPWGPSRGRCCAIPSGHRAGRRRAARLSGDCGPGACPVRTEQPASPAGHRRQPALRGPAEPASRRQARDARVFAGGQPTRGERTTSTGRSPEERTLRPCRVERPAPAGSRICCVVTHPCGRGRRPAPAVATGLARPSGLRTETLAMHPPGWRRACLTGRPDTSEPSHRAAWRRRGPASDAPARPVPAAPDACGGRPPSTGPSPGSPPRA